MILNVSDVILYYLGRNGRLNQEAVQVDLAEVNAVFTAVVKLLYSCGKALIEAVRKIVLNPVVN